MKYKAKPAWVVVLTISIALVLTGCIAALGSQKSTGGDVALPFQSVSGELLKTCSFPVCLPATLPAPEEGDEWRIFSEINSESFSIEIDQLPIGHTDQARSNAHWFGGLSANADFAGPAAEPLEQQFQDANTKVRDISLPDGINGKEYINDPNVASGTAITWQTGSWRFFVTAYPESEVEFSTTHYANEIINVLKDSGQALPGLQGKFDFTYNGNMPMTKVYWEVQDGVWYEFDTRLPNDAITILQSMKTL